MKRFLLLAAAVLMAAGACAPAQVLRIWLQAPHVHDGTSDLVSAWEEGFRRAHPEVTFVNTRVGDEAGLGGLYTGAADVAIMDRPPLPIEVDGYQQGEGHDPTGVMVATGSLDNPHRSPALAIVVARANPLASISLQQLDAVYDADHRRGMQRVHTWGDLGLNDAWANRAVHLYGFRINQDQSFLFERDVMKSSQKWREGLREFTSPAAVTAAVAKDPDAIGITSLDGLNSSVKVLAVQDDEGAVVKPTADSLSAGGYPLARHVYAYFNRDRKAQYVLVQTFIEYCLGEQAQALTRNTGFLPLSPKALGASLEAVK